MQEYLSKFLTLYGKQIEGLYGASDSAWTDVQAIQQSPLWKAVSDMYDYGVMGTPTGNLYPKGHIYGAHGEAERFLCAMDTPQMRLCLEECGNAPPRLALLAVQSAVARMVLDGGWRETDYGATDSVS